MPAATVAGAANNLSMQFGSNPQGVVTFNSAFPLNTLTDATLEFWVKPTGTIPEMDILWTRTDSRMMPTASIWASTLAAIRVGSS